MSHCYRIKVRGFHCDLYGHVNNARYLEFLEEARWDYVGGAPHLATLADRGQAFIIAAITIQYKRPAGLGVELEIRSAMSAVESRRGIMTQDIYNVETDKIVAAAEVTFAIIEMATGRAVTMDADLRAALGAADAGQDAP